MARDAPTWLFNDIGRRCSQLRRHAIAHDGFFDGHGRDGFYFWHAETDDDAGVVELEVIATRTDAVAYFAAHYGPLVRVTVIGDRSQCAGSYRGPFRPAPEPT